MTSIHSKLYQRQKLSSLLPIFCEQVTSQCSQDLSHLSNHPSDPNPEQLMGFSAQEETTMWEANPESQLDYGVETLVIKGT